MRRVRVRAAGVLRVRIVVVGCATILFRKQFLDFPVALFGADAEFEIFFCDGVPVLFVQQYQSHGLNLLDVADGEMKRLWQRKEGRSGR